MVSMTTISAPTGAAKNTVSASPKGSHEGAREAFASLLNSDKGGARNKTQSPLDHSQNSFRSSETNQPGLNQGVDGFVRPMDVQQVHDAALPESVVERDAEEPSTGSFEHLLATEMDDAKNSLEAFIQMESGNKSHPGLTRGMAYSQHEVSEAFDLDSLPPDVLAMVRDLIEAKKPDQENVTELLDRAEEAGPEVLAVVQQFLSYKRNAVAEGSNYGRMAGQSALNDINGGAEQHARQAPLDRSSETSRPQDHRDVRQQPLNRDFVSQQVQQGQQSPLIRTSGASLFPEAREVGLVVPTSTSDIMGIPRSPGAVPELTPITIPRDFRHPGAELASLLGDRLNLQVKQGIKEATVRLDPPELGKLDLSIRSDNDKLSIVINTHNPQTRDLVLQNLERLRMELISGNQGQVDVEVGYQSGDQKESQQDGSNRSNGIIASNTGDADEKDGAGSKNPGNKHWLSISA